TSLHGSIDGEALSSLLNKRSQKLDLGSPVFTALDLQYTLDGLIYRTSRMTYVIGTPRFPKLPVSGWGVTFEYLIKRCAYVFPTTSAGLLPSPTPLSHSVSCTQLAIEHRSQLTLPMRSPVSTPPSKALTYNNGQ